MTMAPRTHAVETFRVIADDIRIAHSVFALPFALLAAFMAGTTSGDLDWRRFSGQLVLIILAMVLARTVAMLSNRLIDRTIDAANPRTAGRAIPSGRLRASHAVTVLIGCAVGFMIICAAFALLYGNVWPLILGLPVLAWISAYGYFKRFTALCHLYLGSSLAISPVAAAIAIDPGALAVPSIWLISGMVLFWVAGFDVIYALQDQAIDRAQGLRSIPQRFGAAGALRISRLLHVLAAGFLIAAWLVDDRFSVLFGAGVVIVCLLLVIEHATVARRGTMRIALTFFTLNGIISCLLGVLGIADVMG